MFVLNLEGTVNNFEPNPYETNKISSGPVDECREILGHPPMKMERFSRPTAAGNQNQVFLPGSLSGIALLFEDPVRKLANQVTRLTWRTL